MNEILSSQRIVLAALLVAAWVPAATLAAPGAPRGSGLVSEASAQTAEGGATGECPVELAPVRVMARG